MRFLIWYILFTSVVLAQDTNKHYKGNNTILEMLVDWKHSTGDNPEWSKPDFDDSEWRRVNFRSMGLNGNTDGWLRKKVKLLDTIQDPNRIILSFYFLRTYFDIYWDGVLVHQSSNHPEKILKSEAPKSHTNILLPVKLCTAGEHTIAVRFRDFYPTAGRYGFLAFLEYNGVYHCNSIRYLLSNAFLLGFMLSCTIIGIVLLWGGKRYYPFIFFTLLCLLSLFWKGGMLTLHHHNLSINWIKFLFTYELLAYALFDVFLILFIVYQLNIPLKILHITVITLSNAIFVAIYILYNQQYWGIAEYYSLANIYVICLFVYSVRKKAPGSIHILVGFVFYAIITSAPFVKPIFRHSEMEAAAFTFLLVSIIFSVRYYLKDKEKREHNLELRTQRLEIELLKKSIQPHFLINTLSAIKSLAKQSPEKADTLVQAVAAELKLINKISSEKLISIKSELDLCRYHLDIMEFRKEAEYKLHLEEIDYNETIPPLVFHTLIENSITHAFRPLENGNIWISLEKNNGNLIYHLSNDGSLLKKYIESSTEKVTEGMGINYVKARLEESYPKNWNIDYGYKENLWQVNIVIKRNSK